MLRFVRQALASSAAVIVVFLALGTSLAFAYSEEEFMNHTFLESGHNYFSPTHTIYLVWGESAGIAAACVGIQYVGDNCGGEGQYVEYVHPGGAYDSAYLHDHSTWNSYFYAGDLYS